MRKSFKLKSADNVNMLTGYIWEPEGEPRAVVQLSHGMIEFIERYDDFARFLCDKGIVVVGHNHIGHGGSVSTDDDFGYWGEKDGGAIIVHDLYHITKIMKRRYPELPYIILGHSMGSFMLRRYLVNHSDVIDGAIIMGTGSQPEMVLKFGRGVSRLISLVKGSHYRSEFIDKMAFGTYNNRIIKAGGKGDWRTSDEEILEPINQDKRSTFKFTASAFKQFFETISYVQKKSNIDKIRKSLPILVVSGEEDPVGNYGKGVKKAHKALCKAGIWNVKLEIFPGARHELINEVNRAEYYDYLANWIEEVIVATNDSKER